MRTILRPVAACAAAALVLSGLGLVAAPTAVAAPPYDPAPASAGASWVTTQLSPANLLSIHVGGSNFDDYGLSADLAISLAEIGGHAATVTAISDAVKAHVNDYAGDDAAGESYAGSLAKSAVLAKAAGADPTSFGGEDLVTRLEARVITAAGATQGRIKDLSAFGEFANVIGQAFAVQALDDANSSLTDSATDFLLEQQCAAGFFRLSFAPEAAADQTCDGGAGTADTDVTAYAVLFLRSQVSDPDVSAALTKAVTWLQTSQRADGSFGGGGPTADPNANSTGLAGWALGDSGATADAEQAATWLRQHQLAKAGGCANSAAADKGAVAYDDAARTAAAAAPLTVTTRDQYVRATAQALPALRWAPLGASSVSTVKPAKGEFQRAGSKVTISVTTANPGDLVCVALRTDAPVATLIADASGGASTTVTLPPGDGTRVYNVADSSGAVATHTFSVLDKAKFKVKAPKAVHRRDRVAVKISGLARDEHYKVFVDGKRVKKGVATGKGRTKVTLRAGGLGRHKVTVVGEYADRKGKTTYRVVR
jgi:hypothetical protein